MNARLILNNRIVENNTLLFDKQIIAIDSNVTLDDVEVIDAKGSYVSPGFIDIHIHGSGDADVMDATPEALETISATLPKTGTTSFLATTMTMPQEEILRALENVRTCQGDLCGAEIIGVHLEGPFLNKNKHGAQDADYIQQPTTQWIEAYLDVVRIITLSPEVEGGTAFIERMHEIAPDVILSIGHSEANYEESMASFDAGISHVTHLFNAMPVYHHRKPGIVGACFDRADISCDIIADLVHTHPHHLRLSQRMKKDQLFLITDAMRAGCMQNGTYDLGGREVRVSGNKAVLADGTLAGSVLQMNTALKNMVDHTEMTLPEAVFCVTQAPARKLKLTKGVLEAGYDADIVIFDEDFSIITTIVAGEIKYQRSQ